MQLKYLLFGLVFVLFLGTVSAFVDVNITKPGMVDSNYSYYVSNNINSGNVFIDFNYFDSNTVILFPGYRLDANIYYSFDANNYQTAIVTDLNLLKDGNRTVSSADSNKYIWRWGTSSYTLTDGNYHIDINVFNNLYRQVGSVSDGNMDSNRSGRTFTIDNTVPTIAISSSATPTSSSYTLIYSGTDATAGIKKYWVSSDNTAWIDNARNLTYNFTAPIFPSNATFYVKSQDYADNNSTTTSIVVTPTTSGGTPIGPGYCGDNACQNSETSANCPADCPAVCGDGACTRSENAQSCSQDCATAIVCGNGICEDSENFGQCPTDCRTRGQIVKQIVRQRNWDRQATSQEVSSILTAAGASQSAIERASDAGSITSTQRKAEVIKETSNGQDTFVSKFTIKVTNTSSEKLKNVKIVEQIPKSVASNASEIVSNYRVRILKADPIVEFTVDELGAGEDAEVSYAVERQVDEQALSEFKAPVVSSVLLSEATNDLCADKSCNDTNLCTVDSCSDGTCFFTPVVDGTICGFGKECRSGNCVQIQVSNGQQAASEKSPLNFTVLVVALLVIVMAVGFYYYTQQSKPHSNKKK